MQVYCKKIPLDRMFVPGLLSLLTLACLVHFAQSTAQGQEMEEVNASVKIIEAAQIWRHLQQADADKESQEETLEETQEETQDETQEEPQEETREGSVGNALVGSVSKREQIRAGVRARRRAKAAAAKAELEAGNEIDSSPSDPMMASFIGSLSALQSDEFPPASPSLPSPPPKPPRGQRTKEWTREQREIKRMKAEQAEELEKELERQLTEEGTGAAEPDFHSSRRKTRTRPDSKVEEEPASEVEEHDRQTARKIRRSQPGSEEEGKLGEGSSSSPQSFKSRAPRSPTRTPASTDSTESEPSEMRPKIKSTAEKPQRKPAVATMKNSIPAKILNTGARVPLLGIGTWNSAPAEVGAAVYRALKVGYRHVDCSPIYMNEPEVGDAFSKAFSGPEAVVSREDVFITSKLWNSEHAAADVEPACRKTLRDLQLDYLDLYLIHWPVTGNTGPELSPSTAETWAAMEALLSKGIVKAIGISNFSIKKIEDLLHTAKIIPAMNQVELHPYWKQESLIKFCRQKGIAVTAYSPLGSPDTKYGMKYKFKLLQDPAVNAIAAQVGKSPAQVLIRWALQRGTIVIPKSVEDHQMDENIDMEGWDLPPSAMKLLNSFSVQERMMKGDMFLRKTGPYKTLAEFWDE